MAKIKYKKGDKIGINNILFVKRTSKANNGQWNAIFKCPFCGKEFEAKIANIVNGHTTSCGCLRSPNLVGQKFGRLLVIKDLGTDNSNHIRKYECLCDCGNKTIVAARHLLSGATKSCGCYQKECIAKVGASTKVDLTNKKFGKLLVIKLLPRTEMKYGASRVWLCKCDCGNYTKVAASILNSGSVQSCGKCHFSRGEQKISEVLDSLCIKYETEYIFNDCFNPQTHKQLRFDFYLPKYNCCIEYDGIQHFQETAWRHESLSKVQYRDDIKNEYCKQNNIQLIRIPYWDLEKINKQYLQQILLQSNAQYLINYLDNKDFQFLDQYYNQGFEVIPQIYKRIITP